MPEVSPAVPVQGNYDVAYAGGGFVPATPVGGQAAPDNRTPHGFTRVAGYDSIGVEHKPAEVFGCSVCGRTFGKKMSLLAHMRCHKPKQPKEAKS